jgi:hypothetical protein
MAHEPCNVDRCRDDAEAVANDLAGNEKGIHGRPPPQRRILVGLSSARCPRAPTGGEPRLRPIVGSKPGSAVKTRGRTANPTVKPYFFACERFCAGGWSISATEPSPTRALARRTPQAPGHAARSRSLAA